MKKTFIIIGMFILMSYSVLAVYGRIPVLTNSIDVSKQSVGYGGDPGNNYLVIGNNDVVGVLTKYSSRSNFSIYNYQGTLLYDLDGIAAYGAFSHGFDINDDFIVYCASNGPSGYSTALVFFDIRNKDFITLRNVSAGRALYYVPMCKIIYYDGSELKVQRGHTDILTLNVGSWGIDYENITGANDIAVVDQANSIYTASNDFYSFANINNHTVIGSTAWSNIVAWNNDVLDPEYITSDGHIVNVGGSAYNDILSTGYGVNFTSFGLLSRSQIYGIVNNEFVIGDMSSSNVSVLYTGVSANDADSSQISMYGDKIFTLNRTNDIVNVFQVASVSSQVCDYYVNGCLINESFSFSDSVLNHGWDGASVYPSYKRYMCLNNYQRSTKTFSFPVYENFIVSFDASVCNGSTSNENINFGIYDVNGGYVFYHNYNNGVVKDLNGYTVGTFEANCNSYSSTHNFKYIIYPSSQLYEFYVDNVKQAIPTDGYGNPKNTFSTNYNIIGAEISSNFFPNYCNFTLDNLNVYTTSGTFEGITYTNNTNNGQTSIGKLTLAPGSKSNSFINFEFGNSSVDWSKCNKDSEGRLTEDS